MVPIGSGDTMRTAPVLTLFLACSVLAQQPQTQLRSIPPAEATKEARRLVKDLFGKEYEDATLPTAKVSLSRKLRDLATKTTDDDVSRYALFLEARDLSVSAVSPKAAVEVVVAIGNDFRVDVLSMKSETLSVLSKLTKFGSQHSELASEALSLAQEASAEDEFDIAMTACGLASESAKASGDAVLQKNIESQVTKVAALKTAFDEAKTALARLEDSPTDPTANLIAGRYYCFLKGDWTRGLTMLALCNDPTLKSLAQQELRKPSSKEAVIALADAWWNQSNKEKPDIKLSMQRRAASWYRAVVPQLAGFTKVRVEKRIASIPEADEAPTTLAGGLAGLTEDARNERVIQNGGTAKSEQAVKLALEWIARVQDANTGGWSLRRPFSDGAQYENTSAATGLALLALQGAGNTHKDGRFRTSVNKGWAFLLKQQQPDGNMFDDGPSRQQLYTHGICTMAICELYGMTKDAKFKQPAELAVRFCVVNQDRLGGWRYTPGSDSDTSVTGWVVSGLHSAADAGFKLPEKTLAGIDEYLTKAGKSRGAKYGYQAGSAETPVMTAAGLLCRQHLGWATSDERMTEGVDWLLAAHLPRWNADDRNVYYWYYATRVMFNVGGTRWEKWNGVIRDMLIEHQSNTGGEKGSWDPLRPVPDKWGYEAGRLYTTCLSTLVLESYYRSRLK